MNDVMRRMEEGRYDEPPDPEPIYNDRHGERIGAGDLVLFGDPLTGDELLRAVGRVERFGDWDVDDRDELIGTPAHGAAVPPSLHVAFAVGDSEQATGNIISHGYTEIVVEYEDVRKLTPSQEEGEE